MGRYFSEKNLLDIDPNSSPQDIKEGLAIPDNGKGDAQRPAQTNAQQIARNWCRTFGHKLNVEIMVCRDCGLTDEAIKTLGETIIGWQAKS